MREREGGREREGDIKRKKRVKEKKGKINSDGRREWEIDRKKIC